MNKPSYFVIVVRYGDTRRDLDAVLRGHTHQNERTHETSTGARSQQIDAEELPLWRWFTFEKSALF